MFGWKMIHMFPDFMLEVAKQRAGFATVKRDPDVRFSLRYPATLHSSLPGGQVKRFDNPDSAMSEYSGSKLLCLLLAVANS